MIEDDDDEESMSSQQKVAIALLKQLVQQGMSNERRFHMAQLLDLIPEANPWRPISTVPDDDNVWIIVQTSSKSVAPGHVIKIKRGMLSDRAGPRHLRVFASHWMPYIEPNDD